MERNLERKTLSFGKGMTNVPSDLLSDDSELAFCKDFLYRDGEIKPIQRMRNIGNIDGKIMHVHKMADFENIIAYDEANGGTLTWYNKNGNIIEGPKKTFTNVGVVSDIKSVGNTLVVATDKSIRYYLFKGGKYVDLGSELPIPFFQPYFEMQTSEFNSYKCELAEIVKGEDVTAWYDAEGNFIGFFNQNPGSEEDHYQQGEHGYTHNIIKDRENDYLDAVEGCVMKGVEGEKEYNRFLFPFFIRYALKLYDGTYTRISAPIACYPTISRNCYFYNSATNGKNDNFFFVPRSSTLKYASSISGIENWSDIVKELTIFASDEVMPYYDIASRKTMDWRLFIGETKYLTKDYSPIYYNTLEAKGEYEDVITYDVILPRYKSDGEIIEELLSKTQFFKLASLKTSNSDDVNVRLEYNKALPLKRNVVSTLTTQEQLKKDDYYGWTNLYAKNLYPYNNRLNVFDLERFPFKGFNNFLATKGVNGDGTKITYYVHIVSRSMDCWVKSEESEYFQENTLTGWLYYPDPNATEMIIHIAGPSKDKKIRVSLNSHSMLNGAYSFENLPTESSAISSESVSLPVVDESAHETLDSQIFTSVVNNPFVFESSGDNTVGTGRILGIVANTEAVSQGQFGQYPLLVFTDEGIYAMSTNLEGLYSSIHPISREVCNNTSSITPTDKVVFFTSEKGLMATSGSEAICVSERLSNGKSRGLPQEYQSFRKFISNCMIAYDYKASLLRIFSKSYNYHYVYNMVEKNFTVAQNYAEEGISCRNVVNNYPDNLVQYSNGLVYSLTGIPLSEDDAYNYAGSFTTRPLKLGGSMNLKSLRAVKHLFDSDNGKIAMEIYGSNDCKHWNKLISLGGKPWKYFTFKYALTNFKATDSFAGSIVEVQNRREDKIR